MNDKRVIKRFRREVDLLKRRHKIAIAERDHELERRDIQLRIATRERDVLLAAESWDEFQRAKQQVRASRDVMTRFLFG